MQRSALGSDVFWRPRSEILDFSFFSVILFAKCWWVETSFAIFRVPRMYRQTGFCRFLGFLGLWKINNLPVFSAPWRFDSVPGHHFFPYLNRNLQRSGAHGRAQQKREGEAL
jgi:hypothetical protein